MPQFPIWLVVASDSKFAGYPKFFDTVSVQYCDGINDQQEIQTAIDNMPSTGGMVLLTDGTFTFGVDLTKTGASVNGDTAITGSGVLCSQADCWIAGMGNSTLIKSVAAGGGSDSGGRYQPMFGLSAPRITLSDFQVDQTAVTDNNTLRDVVRSMKTAAQGALGEWRLRNIRVIDGREGFTLQNQNYVWISGCYIKGTKKNAFSSSGSGGESYWHVSDCTFENIGTDYGAAFTSWTLTSAQECTVTGCSDINTGGPDISGSSPSKGVTIANYTASSVTKFLNSEVSGGIAENILLVNYRGNGATASSLISSRFADIRMINCAFNWSHTPVFFYQSTNNGGEVYMQNCLLNGPTSSGMFDVANNTKIRIFQTKGYVTENGGTGTITSGNTSVSVTHGLDTTPAAKHIYVTPTNNPTNDPGNMWIDTVGSSTFTVNCRSNPGTSGLTFSWRAEIL